MAVRSARVLLVNGTVGVGKTSTAAAVGEHLRRSGVSGAVIDLDALRRAWPAPADDPFHLRLTLANVRDLASNARAAGLERLVLSGVVESRAEKAQYVDAVGGGLVLVRLRSSPSEVSAQLRRRHVDDPEGLPWHLARAVELNGILETADADDHIVETAGRGIDVVAAEVMARVGWPDLTSDETSS